MYPNRRQSMGVIERGESKCDKPFPRRNSTIVTKCTTPPKRQLLNRRHSELSFPEIQKIYKTENEAHRLQRQYSVICTPKEISFREPSSKSNYSCKGYKMGRKMSSDNFVLPRIPSVTPEPDIVKFASQDDVRYDADGNSYTPKHCWCFRCQIMYGMYTNGDERLANWGNYPCFRR